MKETISCGQNGLTNCSLVYCQVLLGFCIDSRMTFNQIGIFCLLVFFWEKSTKYPAHSDPKDIDQILVQWSALMITKEKCSPCVCIRKSILQDKFGIITISFHSTICKCAVMLRCYIFQQQKTSLNKRKCKATFCPILISYWIKLSSTNLQDYDLTGEYGIWD